MVFKKLTIMIKNYRIQVVDTGDKKEYYIQIPYLFLFWKDYDEYVYDSFQDCIDEIQKIKQ